jgi:beta-glucosidase/6-phospho-beta-glucosidase/beta-galactosidase
MNLRPGIFPTFFLSGFECSTFLWKDQGRRNLCDETQHRHHADDDYHFLSTLGIAVAREGIPWPIVDKGAGRFDFSYIDPFLAAMRVHKILPIWDLCHYGYPDGADPFSDDFANRFAEYARAAAAYVIERHHGPYFFTPINEITFFGYMAAEWGWCAPFGESLACRVDFTTALARADVAAARAIRDLCPQARFVHIDPLIHVVAPRDRPDLEAAAHDEANDVAFLAFDIIAGHKAPEFGGSPELLDIVGLNNYSFGQMEYRQGQPNVALDPDDPRIVPVADLIERAWQRYHRPTIIAETSGLKGGRDEWLDDIMNECMTAVQRGVELHGICLFPAVDMPDWHTGEWLNNGMADLERTSDGDLKRVPFEPYVNMAGTAETGEDAGHRPVRRARRSERRHGGGRRPGVQLRRELALAQRAGHQFVQP